MFTRKTRHIHESLTETTQRHVQGKTDITRHTVRQLHASLHSLYCFVYRRDEVPQDDLHKL